MILSENLFSIDIDLELNTIIVTMQVLEMVY